MRGRRVSVWKRNEQCHVTGIAIVDVGAAAGESATCDSIDFNNDGVSPDTTDIELFLFVFGGGSC